jgi:hypothetical protein
VQVRVLAFQVRTPVPLDTVWTVRTPSTWVALFTPVPTGVEAVVEV